MEQGDIAHSTPAPEGQSVEAQMETAIGRLLTAPAQGHTPDVRALVAYSSWLYSERAHLCREMYPHLGWKAAAFVVGDNAGFDFHRPRTAPPSTRAVAVLSSVGCDWSQDSYLGIGFEPSTTDVPHSDRFPHPDAHLFDLGDAFFAAHAKHVECATETKAAHSIYEQHLKDHEEEDCPLLIKREKYLKYWSGEVIRKILAGRYYPTIVEAPLVDAKSRADWERLLPLAEARDGRVKEALDACGYEALAERDEEILQAADAAAQAVFRLRAQTFEGIELKVRIVKATDPHLWNRPGFFEKAYGEWHEYALTEIADSVTPLLAQGRCKPTDEVNGNLFSELTAISGGVVRDDGIVCFTDATGKLLYEPVAKWVAMTAMRLHHVARSELARQISDPNLAPVERRELDYRLRQELRTDAIEALAFRPMDAFKIADAERHGRVEIVPLPAQPPLGAVSPDLTRAMEAHREIQQLMLHDPDMDDARLDAGNGRMAEAEAALLAVPSRSLADLRHKLIYLWPGSLEDHVPSERIRSMMENFREELLDLCRDTSPNPDASLVDLGSSLQAASDNLKRHEVEFADDVSEAANARFEEVYEAGSALVKKIEAHPPAQTLVGLIAKAKAVSWCHCGDPISGEDFVPEPAADVRLAASIVADLLAMEAWA